MSDPFIFDVDRLRALASEAVVRRGIAYFKAHRVVSIGWDDGRVWAEVEGARPDLRYAVDVALDEDREPLACCTCPYDLEPACKHVVATLLAYAAQVAASEVDNAAEQAILERQKRARTEVIVNHVSGEPAFGTWSAFTVTDAGARLRPYRVHIRSKRERMNACTCPDFALNRLGTCKHIEAVLHQLDKRKVPASEPALPVVYLDYAGASDRSEPVIRLRRSARAPAEAELAQRLERHFTPAGELRAALPDAWAALERDLGERDDIHLGEDARAHATRLLTELAHARRKDAIRDAIKRSGGHLPGIRARLYPYQTEGVAFLASAGRALLADDMGLGKTLQTIAAARWLIDHEGVRRVLVVCPASLKSQWAREIKRFTDLEATVIEGGLEPRLARYRQATTFTIVNYELVVRDLGAIATELNPDLLVLDEAQRIKNWRTKTAATIKSLTTRYAFVLSGTPLENRLEDLYSVMQVVDARVLGPLWHFMLHFHVSDERGKVVAYRNLSELRQRLTGVMLRRDKRLVKDQLPERVVQTVPVPMSDRQTQIHDGALAAASRLAQIMSKRPLTPSEEAQMLAALQTARMACDAAGLVDEETVGSPKLDELARILEASCIDGGDKVVVFSQWERMTRMAEAVARELGLGVARLHGGVPSSARGALVDRFREDPDVKVFISTDAGSTGLNLQNASVFVNLDMPWNPAVLEQRIGRVHRLGQASRVHVYLLISENSYEERVASMVRAKGELFGAVVDPEAGGDVVAVTRRMIEAAVEALEVAPVADDVGATPVDVEGAGEPELAGTLAQPTGTPPSRSPSDDDDLGPELREAVAAAERAFAGRIEQMLVTGKGLVVIVDRVDLELQAIAATIATTLDVAVLDRRTWQALSRMGTVGPSREVRSAPVVATPVVAPLVALARRQLAAAEVLVAQSIGGPALALVTQAMLAKSAADAGRDTAPDAEGAAVWLFGEAVPRGFVPAAVANDILCAHSLSRVAEPPAAVVKDLVFRARAFVGVQAPAQ